ncbi:hypothetical protein [Halosimplex halobium]|uniref:hypothetical protein n=1 Tax=Halosimplex halobium TaxID=3396618 RepID=UPI003F56614F
MSPDDTDPDRDEEREADRSEADADDGTGGQPRDPETGQFLPKDQRGDAGDGGDDTGDGLDDSSAAGTCSESAAPHPDRGDTATERTGSTLRFTRVSPGTERGRPPGRSQPWGADPVLPLSLHLVPMQVQLTGERVRGPTASEPADRGGSRRLSRQP